MQQFPTLPAAHTRSIFQQGWLPLCSCVPAPFPKSVIFCLHLFIIHSSNTCPANTRWVARW